MRIVMIISAMTAGGGQRVVASLANEWAASGDEVTLLTFEPPAAKSFFDLDPRIGVIRLDLMREARSPLSAVVANARRLRVIRSAIRRAAPDVVVGVLDQTNVLTILAARSLRLPVVVMELTAPGVHDIGRAWQLLRRWTYPHAQRVVTESEAAFAPLWFVPARRRGFIPHYVEAAPVRERERVVAVACRLVSMKRVDWIIRAFAAATPAEVESEPWRLVIMGDGPERAALERLANESGVSDRVAFTGEVRDVPFRLAGAEVFVLASEYEGFSVALCEAMAAGCAVLSVDCPFGPRAIMQPDIDGLLVEPSYDALRQGLASLLRDAPLRERLRRGTGVFRERFSKEAILRQWRSVLDDAAVRGEARGSAQQPL